MVSYVEESVRLSELRFDPANLRLPRSADVSDQEEILVYIARTYDLEEIGWSMAEHGFFEEEPLLTVLQADESRLVVEGNRRLATLKLLTEEGSRRAARVPKFWDELAEFAADHILDPVPTHRYPDARSLLGYLGFRHVSGLMEWSADAKARFIYSLITSYEMTFRQAGVSIGSRSDAIRRNFIAWAAIEQSVAAGKDVEAIERRFGVFYRALQNPGYRRFITMANGRDPWIDGTEEDTEPLAPENGPERVEELGEMLFGSRRVITDSRQIDDLGKVLVDPGALAILRQERRLDIALQELPASRDAFYAALRRAYRNAAVANGEAYNFTGEEEFVVEARRLADISAQLLRTLER